jgi:hypothetical protein
VLDAHGVTLTEYYGHFRHIKMQKDRRLIDEALDDPVGPLMLEYLARVLDVPKSCLFRPTTCTHGGAPPQQQQA